MEEKTNNSKAISSVLPEENNTQTVGDILRHARLKQGKTLNDVSEVLCIRRIYLEAIENVEYKKLPVEPYGIGYVRNYADYLGLNSARIVQSFKETAIPKSNNKKGLKTIGDEINSNTPKFWHAFLGLMVLFSILIGWNYYQQYATNPSVEIVDTSISETYPTPLIIEEDEGSYTEDFAAPEENIAERSYKAQPEVQEEPIDINKNTETNEEIIKETTSPRIKIEVIGDSWLELKHNDEVLLAKVYHKGFEYEVPYNENLEVSVGKRANVKFYIDGNLTEVTSPKKQMKIKLDEFLEKRQ